MNSDTTTYMVQRSMRDITGRAIAVAANVNVAASTSGRMYPILGPQNKIIDSAYAGDVNIMGNVPVQIANSPSSSYLHAFDYASLALGINYRYMAILPTDTNIVVNAQVAKAMQEALAHAYSETFNDLNFFNATYDRTSMSMPTGFGAADVIPDAADYLPAFTFYQGILQNILLLDAKYKQLMAMEEPMMDQAWLRETPQLKQLFGLLKKQSIRSYLEAITSMIPGNAVDVEWSRQINILCNVPSKKTNSYDDPMIVIDAYCKLPQQLKITYPATSSAGSAVLLDYNADAEVGEGPIPAYHCRVYDRATGVTSVYNVETLFFNTISLLSPYNVAYYCRQIATGETTFTPRDYYNMLDTRLSALSNMLSRFTQDFADLNVVLKVMNRVGLNNWQYGVITTPLKVGLSYTPVYNKLLYDVFSSTLSGGDQMTWDDNTKRWRFWTMWDKLKDIPAYDSVSGGAFLTFSTRTIPYTATPTAIRYCVPVLFDVTGSTTVKFLNRLNHQYIVQALYWSAADVAADPVFCRLQAVSQPSMTFKLPNVVRNTAYDGYLMDESFLIKTLSSICGACVLSTPVEQGTATILNKTLNDTVMNMLDIEMDDISNVMINQARCNAPFRVNAPGPEVVGFQKVMA